MSIDWTGIISKVYGEECKREVTPKLKREVSKALDSLSWRESYAIVIRSRGMTLAELGLMLDVTRERARQLEAKGLRKLRHPSRLSLMKEFMEDTCYD